jgi:hypothetical protein
VAWLASVDPTFPLHLWDILLPQVEITLNLLRTSRLHPQLSAADHFHGLVDYNKKLLLLQDAKSLHTRNQENDVRGHPMGNMDIIWAQQCITTAVKMSTSRLRLANVLWTHSSFFPHNYQMPQLSSTDTLLMAANDMSNALQNPHPEVPFTHVGDDPISALTALAETFKLKFQKVHIPILPAPPANVTQRTCLAESSYPILAYPMPPPRQTRPQTKIHARDMTNAPLLLRVVTPMKSQPSPPRVPRHSQNLAPRNLSQYDFCGMDKAHMAIALGNRNWPQQYQANAVIHPITGKEIEYIALMKDPRLQPLWKRGFGNKVGRLFQGIRYIPGTDTCFFIKLTKIPKDRQITYGKIVCDYKPHKKEKERVRLTIGGDRLD